MSCNPSWPEVRVAAASERGRHRRENQDAFALLPEQRAFVLADGMGGQASGDVASRSAVGAAPGLVNKKLEDRRKLSAEETSLRLNEVATELNTRLREEASAHPALHGMGTTLVLLIADDSNAYVMHVGDSRAYLFRDKQITRLTEDHTIGAMLVRLGEITPHDAEKMPEVRGLSRYLGAEGEVHPDVRHVTIRKGDRFLLCSDGLTGAVADDRIAVLLGENADPQEACNVLIASAQAAGGGDDISVIVVDVVATGPDQSPPSTSKP